MTEPGIRKQSAFTCPPTPGRSDGRRVCVQKGNSYTIQLSKAIERLVIRGERHLESLPNAVIRNVLSGLTLARHGNEVKEDFSDKKMSNERYKLSTCQSSISPGF
jgi:hypothetical protein